MNFSATFLLVIFMVSISMLAYIYAGYPLIIIVMAKFFHHPVQKAAISPGITMVIPTHNEEAVISEKLENSLSLDYPRENMQILVCDDASEDSTTAIVRTYASAGVELSEGIVRSGKVGGLNRALQMATGEIFIISDADILVSPYAVRELVANFADQTVGCVVAQTHMMSSDEEKTGESGGLYWRYEALIRQSESDIHSTVAATGHLMAIRRNLLQPIPTNIIVDDFYLAMMTARQGYRVISESKAIVWERPTNSMGDEVNRRRRMTAGRYQAIMMSRAYLPQLPILLRFEVISHKFLRLTIPHFMILALISNIMFTLGTLQEWSINPTNWTTLTNITLATQGIFYCMAIAGKFLSERTIKKSGLIKLLVLPYYLCATNFASIAGLIKHLSGKGTVFWEQARRR